MNRALIIPLMIIGLAGAIVSSAMKSVFGMVLSGVAFFIATMILAGEE